MAHCQNIVIQWARKSLIISGRTQVQVVIMGVLALCYEHSLPKLPWEQSEPFVFS